MTWRATSAGPQEEVQSALKFAHFLPLMQDMITAVDGHELGMAATATQEAEKAWPARHCSPRHRMPFNSPNEGLKCVSMTWRAMVVCPWVVSSRYVTAFHSTLVPSLWCLLPVVFDLPVISWSLVVWPQVILACW